MIRRAALLTLLLVGGAVGAQSPVIRFDDAGQGPGPRFLAQVLTGQYRVIPPGPAPVLLPRDSVYRGTVIVLGRTATLDGTVEGHLIVIGGDLHLHPRSVVRGRAVTMGGGVYESSMSQVGGIDAFREFTYDIADVPGGYALHYRSFFDRPTAAITLPGLYGLRAPDYDRSNGLSLTVGPLFAIQRPDLKIEPRVTYRSQLGRADPSLALSYGLNSRTTIRASGERNTYTNEGWIWPNVMNSTATLLIGHDAQNHFRASRGQISVSRQWAYAAVSFEPYIGGRGERAFSVRPDSNAVGGPWSFHGRREVDDMLRPNPAIDDGDIYAGLAGLRFTYSDRGVRASLDVDQEIGHFTPRFSDTASSTLVQTTVNGTITFPTFGSQTIRVDVHGVISLGDRAPRQRWAYVGGSGSIPTLALAERGGDQLFYFDGRYEIPIERIGLPALVGPPIITLREIVAGADVGRFPALAQAVGLRLTVGLVYGEFLVDPAERRGNFGIGVSLAR